MIKTSKENRAFDTTFILILLSIFAVTVLLTVIFSMNAYKSINETTNKNFNHISPLSYIASKVRQSDVSDAIRIEEKEETKALVIKTFSDNEIYETWIYNYDGYIYEIYVDEYADFSLSDGTAIYENNKIEFSIDDNKSLTIYNYGLKNKDSLNSMEKPMKLTLSFRSSTN